MIWRFGFYDKTFEPLLHTHWALLAALGLPLMLGMLAALFPPKRAWPVVLASLPVLVSGWLLFSALVTQGCCAGSGKWLVFTCRCA